MDGLRRDADWFGALMEEERRKRRSASFPLLLLGPFRTNFFLFRLLMLNAVLD